MLVSSIISFGVGISRRLGELQELALDAAKTGLEVGRAELQHYDGMVCLSPAVRK